MAAEPTLQYSPAVAGGGCWQWLETNVARAAEGRSPVAIVMGPPRKPLPQRPQRAGRTCKGAHQRRQLYADDVATWPCCARMYAGDASLALLYAADAAVAPSPADPQRQAEEASVEDESVTQALGDSKLNTGAGKSNSVITSHFGRAGTVPSKPGRTQQRNGRAR